MPSFKTRISNKMDINQTVSMLLGCLTNVRLYHWSTQSYAEHVALGDFYSDLSDKLDTLVEEYQGRYILVDLRGQEMTVEPGGGQVVEYLQSVRNAVEANRAQPTFPQDSSLQNVVDEIVGAFNQTIYKLRFLK